MQSLPKGLVTTSPRIPSHLTKDPGKNLVDAGDIALLWKGIRPFTSCPFVLSLCWWVQLITT